MINGAKSGPHALIVACQHGREVSGFAAAVRFCQEIDPGKTAGTVAVVACMNPLAALLGRQAWNEGFERETGPAQKTNPKRNGITIPPLDVFDYDTDFNLNRLWPGKTGDSLANRIVHEVWENAVLGIEPKPSLVVDIHCHDFPSAIYACDASALSLGLLSGLPVVYETGGVGDASLEGACRKIGIPRVLTAELRGNGCAPAQSICEGVGMLFNLLKAEKMLAGELSLPGKVLVIKPWGGAAPRISKEPLSHTVEALHDGILALEKAPLEKVRKGDVIARILDPESGQTLQTATALATGHLGNLHTEVAKIKKGERICRIDTVAKWISPAEAR